MSEYNIFRAFLIATVVISTSYSERILQARLNPECYDLCNESNVTTVHVTSEGPNDTIHYIWDFAGKPSVLVAVTSPKAKLQIDWKPFLWGEQNTVKFDEIPKYTFGMVLLKIYEFNDLEDTGLLSSIDDRNINVLHTKKFTWNRKVFAQNDKYVELDIAGTNYQSGQVTRTGSVKFLLNAFNTLDHSDIMPHILHSENATQIDLVLDNLETNSSFTNSRFAVELLMISSHSPESSLIIDVKKTLDDEHTPGIFEMVEVKTPGSEDTQNRLNNDRELGGYLQWRPVSYMNATRDISSATDAVYYPLNMVTDHVASANNSLLYAFYGFDLDKHLLQRLNVSLGGKGDGFYKKNNYSSWTFVIGYGTPPDEQFSFLVIMIIAIGLGLPTIILFAAGLYICVQRKRKSSDHRSLNR